MDEYIERFKQVGLFHHARHGGGGAGGIGGRGTAAHVGHHGSAASGSHGGGSSHVPGGSSQDHHGTHGPSASAHASSHIHSGTGSAAQQQSSPAPDGGSLQNSAGNPQNSLNPPQQPPMASAGSGEQYPSRADEGNVGGTQGGTKYSDNATTTSHYAERHHNHVHAPSGLNSVEYSEDQIQDERIHLCIWVFPADEEYWRLNPPKGFAIGKKREVSNSKVRDTSLDSLDVALGLGGNGGSGGNGGATVKRRGDLSPRGRGSLLSLKRTKSTGTLEKYETEIFSPENHYSPEAHGASASQVNYALKELAKKNYGRFISVPRSPSNSESQMSGSLRSARSNENVVAGRSNSKKKNALSDHNGDLSLNGSPADKKSFNAGTAGNAAESGYISAQSSKGMERISAYNFDLYHQINPKFGHILARLHQRYGYGATLLQNGGNSVNGVNGSGAQGLVNHLKKSEMNMMASKEESAENKLRVQNSSKITPSSDATSQNNNGGNQRGEGRLSSSSSPTSSMTSSGGLGCTNTTLTQTFGHDDTMHFVIDDDMIMVSSPSPIRKCPSEGDLNLHSPLRPAFLDLEEDGGRNVNLGRETLDRQTDTDRDKDNSSGAEGGTQHPKSGYTTEEFTPRRMDKSLDLKLKLNLPGLISSGTPKGGTATATRSNSGTSEQSSVWNNAAVQHARSPQEASFRKFQAILKKRGLHVPGLTTISQTG